MKLSSLSPQQEGTIQRVNCGFEIKHRLYDLGFVPSSRVTLLSSRGRAILVRICKTILCISRREASFIEVADD